jgi:hypothetical protein
VDRAEAVIAMQIEPDVRRQGERGLHLLKKIALPLFANCAFRAVERLGNRVPDFAEAIDQ